MLRRGLWLLGWIALAALSAPLGYAVWVSFSPDSFLTPPTTNWSPRWYIAFVADRRWTFALVRSLFVGCGSALVAVLTGTPLALAVTRYRFAGRGLLAVTTLLPACVPAAVLAMGLLPLLYLAGLWGNVLGLILAHGLLGLPVVYLIVQTQLEQMPPNLEAAARGLGASRWQATVRVTLPLLRPAILAGAAAALALSFNESMLAIFLATPTTETLPAVIWPQLRYAPSPLVAVASCVSVALAAGMVLLLSLLGVKLC